ncbi:putative lipoprotein nlpC [Vibrio nigripulchritudo MADA3029]|uniref:C40 family peptidase n=1 Tax=Vibrio nigripulchritudo TaxID=28173 RepID=UPI0003B1E105|nr:putative lipoprotein nlpC [Vibrio nigripulchritudo AM115]CCN43258.1 putative lipoprotein nlpC [Vibrio nigripulchritudo FTn2]CCN45941.1 putative lipoprotein nlpC [Vibrio nigripulchritudo MADA3020]CCN56009.1 putative lipoprotein nlpC [Vibrio nigripulchritudo MADA3021]CCN59751.1 putative lipoprotein nlpC [Vibrio nigripulchritudo MADA3029]CCN63784.1 putative lipoprotein nlpC [Vibrio nigripulchritudo POn4]CCN77110.1 putative lipoprotein nlpC [Vibrio nigripulchritudo SO65]
MNFQRIISIKAIFVTLLLVGCSQSVPYSSSPPFELGSENHTATQQALSKVYTRWEGVPYRFGGNDRYGLDCSAFTKIAFSEAFSKTLPRTTESQSQLGTKIRYRDAQPGDLVFFKTGFKQRHVGVYMGNNAFMHASTSKGVIISRLDNPYWADAFWHFRRVH